MTGERVIICSYNDHCPAPFYPSLLVGKHHQVYSGLGAGIVMESITPTPPPPPTAGVLSEIAWLRQLEDCWTIERPQAISAKMAH
jgi:hypothetical protein